MSTETDIQTAASYRLAAPPSQMSPENAATILADRFGINGQIELLSGETDRNFRVSAKAQTCLLKVSRIELGAADLGLQAAALRHLEKNAPDIPVPRVVRSMRGEDYVVGLGDDGGRYSVCLMTYLPGCPLADIEGSERHRAATGALLAKLDECLQDFDHPSLNRDLLWDVTHALRTRPLLGEIGSPEKRALVESALEDFEVRVNPEVSSLRRQAIHNDLNPHNILVSGDATELMISGIIDFGDMIKAPLINDLATAIAYIPLGASDPVETIIAITSMYHQTYPLNSIECELLIDLIKVRQAMVIAITEWRANLHPTNRQYILRNSAGAWAGLQALSSIDRRRYVSEVKRIVR